MKKNIIKKLLLIIIIIIIAFCYFLINPEEVKAQTEVSSWEDLHNIRNNLSGDYVLTANLSSSTVGYDTYASSTSNGGTGWLPIGNDTNKFTGTFNGQNHTISDLYINRSADYQGLFGYTDTGSQITNIGLVNVDITVTGTRYFVGGLVGATDSGVILNSYSTGSVNASGSNYIGGLVGVNFCTISNSYSTVSVIGAYYVGGLIGINYETVSNSYSTGSVSGSSYVGGLIGLNSGTVSNSYWNTQTSGQASSSGGEGRTTAQMTSEPYDATTYLNWDFETIWLANTTQVKDHMDNTGYPALFNWEGIKQNSFRIRLDNDDLNSATFQTLENTNTDITVNTKFRIRFQTSNTTSSIDIIRRLEFKEDDGPWTQITTDSNNVRLSESSNFTDAATTTTLLSGMGIFTSGEGKYSSSDTSQITLNTNYYTEDEYSLKFEEGATGKTYQFRITNNGTELNAYPYIPSITALSQNISSWEDLDNIRNGLFGDYILTANLSSSTVGYDTYASSTSNSNTGWLPIGDSTNKFTGTFNGQNYTISDLYINRSANYQGLFGYTDTGSQITNIGLVNVDITGSWSIGSVVGVNLGTISNSYSTGIITGSNNFVGGLVGQNLGTISNSYSTGIITGSNNFVGGLVGQNSSGTISNSYSTGNVTASANNKERGGLVGYNYRGIIRYSYSTGSVNYENEGTYGGGLVGRKDTGGSYEDTSNYYNTETSNWSTSEMGTGKTTAEMQNISTFSDTGWDIGTSESDLNNGYPHLSWQENRDDYVWLIYTITTLSTGRRTPIPTYSIVFEAMPEQGGTVMKGGTYTQGASIGVMAIPNKGYDFLYWGEQDKELSNNPYYSFTVYSDRHITAHFKAIEAMEGIETAEEREERERRNGGLTEDQLKEELRERIKELQKILIGLLKKMLASLILKIGVI